MTKEEAIEELLFMKHIFIAESDADKALDMAIEALQEPKTGKWIECSTSEHWKCSECGCRASYWFNEENSSSYDLDMSEWLSDYCPNCGAWMRGDTDD